MNEWMKGNERTIFDHINFDTNTDIYVITWIIRDETINITYYYFQNNNIQSRRKCEWMHGLENRIEQDNRNRLSFQSHNAHNNNDFITGSNTIVCILFYQSIW